MREQAREQLERVRGRAARGRAGGRDRPAGRRRGSAASSPPCNQFLRSQAGAPGGATVLADQLEVDPGYEVAVAAALDGRLRAAVLADRAAAGDGARSRGSDGGRALVLDAGDACRADAPSRPRRCPGAERLADHIRGPEATVALARRLLRDAWVLDGLDALPDGFAGVAVTRGRTGVVRRDARAPPGGRGGRGARVGRTQPSRDPDPGQRGRRPQAETEARAGARAAGRGARRRSTPTPRARSTRTAPRSTSATRRRKRERRLARDDRAAAHGPGRRAAGGPAHAAAGRAVRGAWRARSGRARAHGPAGPHRAPAGGDRAGPGAAAGHRAA